MEARSEGRPSLLEHPWGATKSYFMSTWDLLIGVLSNQIFAHAPAVCARQALGTQERLGQTQPPPSRRLCPAEEEKVQTNE